ncbi:MAG: Transcriptional regulator [Candidatus Moranbacteria bacterium GW2011_GWE1_49_15]|nr:MAG: Transcriptional regulator [Candidatus Moranbacteria bacterium GW2011_GWE2_47_10]KKW06808.1 MAG: Transcriptional regulator [Candidatus Moranbacteria bacterium GW2011_GWE1_49_15]
MKKLRSERRLSLGEISKGTNVQAKYLECLEEGDYKKLPAQVYVKGFLRNYANFMGVSEQSLLRQYEMEQKIARNIRKDEEEVAGNGKPEKFSSFVVTPKMMVIVLSVIFVFSGFAYLYKQVDNFVSTPRLVIKKPLDGSSVEGRSVRLTGVAEKDSRVYINDQPILVNENGEFSEDVGLGEGLNVITVVAKNQFDKESRQTISVNANYHNVVEPISESGSVERGDAGEGREFGLELHVISNPTWISVEADGNLMYSGVLLPESVQKFEAKEKISVTSGKGNDTFIKLEGKEEEVLSDETGVVRDIIFTPDGRAQ